VARHPSDSREQSSAEGVMLLAFREKYGITLTPKSVAVGPNEHIQMDGWSEKHRILCECYAHQGLVKGGQPHKIMSDAMKLLLAEKRLGGEWRKILLFADERAADSFQQGTWRSVALKELGIEVSVVHLAPSRRKALLRAQERQRMVPDS